MKKSLYHIEREYLDIAEQLESGEVTDELEQALAINQSELQTKAINYGFVIKESEYRSDAIKMEIARLKKMDEVETNKRERLKTAITDAMVMYGIEKVDSPVLKLSFRRSEQLDIINDYQIPDEFKEEKTEVKIDKVMIKAAIKEGREVQGAVIRENRNLQVK